MKKAVYYIIPFISIPLVFLLCELLNNLPFLDMSPLLIGILLFLTAAVIGNLTSAKGRFDVIIAAIMPMALFLFMFLAGFLECGETVARFDFRHGFKIAVENTPWVIYLLVASAAFLASYKPLRVYQKRD